jgi:oligopeptidase A
VNELSTNPLLTRAYRIPFDRIRAEHVVPAVRQALEEAARQVELVAGTEERTYRATLQALDDALEGLDRVIGPVAHLVSVMNSPELRAAYNQVLPDFSGFYARLPLDERLWSVLREFAATEEAQALEGVRRRHLEKTLREFARAGADLPLALKARVAEIQVEISTLQTRFSDNLLDATNAFELVLTRQEELAGLPERVRAQAAANARARGLEGWRFTLQLPSLQPFLQYAERRELRRAMYEAYMNRASGEDHDNRPLIARILELRRELAGILGYDTFADYRLEESMVKTGEAALGFEEELAALTRSVWAEEVRELEAHAATLGLEPLQPWDTAFVAERVRKERFDLDEEQLRPYFPLPSVLEGLFEICNRLFGISVTEREIAQVWHPEVRFYEIHDQEGTHLGSFYTDWFPREEKRGGAWMNALVTGGPDAAGFEPHLGLVCGNFTPPEGERPALLTHREVETTFHEFGHLLHHCLSRVEVKARAGTNVSRDWVELPSQLMENWCWERDALDLFARHFRTGERIPDELFEKLTAARRFMAASAQMRQLSFGTVDLHLHMRYDPERDGDVVGFAQRTMEPFSIRPEFARDHFITGFQHIFSSGYAAGYYSYLWSEVLDADAFTRFREAGLFDRATGEAYVRSILSQGDARDPQELFRQFMGREPDLTALLRRNLGVEPESAAS